MEKAIRQARIDLEIEEEEKLKLEQMEVKKQRSEQSRSQKHADFLEKMRSQASSLSSENLQA